MNENLFNFFGLTVIVYFYMQFSSNYLKLDFYRVRGTCSKYSVSLETVDHQTSIAVNCYIQALN